MIPQITTGSIITVGVIVTVAMIIGLAQISSAADEPKGNKMYIFAEGVTPVATFKFRDATATYEFQAFSQLAGFGSGIRGNTPEFTLQRIVGDTPYLYEAVDQTHRYSTRSALDFSYKEFDATVSMMQAGKPIRIFEYQRCSIIGYKVVTEFDKEEGYTTGGKTGFAVIDQYTFSCAGFQPTNPLYEEMLKPKPPY